MGKESTGNAGDAGDAGQQYYEAEKDSTGLAALSGTNGKTSELDITKIIHEGNTNLTEVIWMQKLSPTE